MDSELFLIKTLANIIKYGKIKITISLIRRWNNARN